MSTRTAGRKLQDTSTITAALLALLTALEGIPAGSPAGAAYTTAIRRGEELAAVDGAEALRTAHAAALGAAPERAEARTIVLNAAWMTIPGWNDQDLTHGY